jgi:hypothetical protein
MVKVSRMVAVLLGMANLTACASIANRPPRLAPSSYGCMEAVLKEKLPVDLPDKRAHCIAGGLIARYCSVTEAYLAGAGKEVRDLVSRGDSAQWQDWQADRAGIECARETEGDAAVVKCCAERGY